MARKDVDLVIRARDQATKVVDSITAAITDFTEAQSNLGDRAKKTDSALGALGLAIGKLDKELRGLSASDQIAQQFAKATTAAGRLKEEFSKTQKTSRDLARDLKAAEAATDRLSAKARGAALAQEKTTAALARAKAEQGKYTTALNAANKERDKAARGETRLAQQIIAQQERVAQAGERYRKLAADVQSTANPTKTLQNRLENANKSFDSQSQKLAKLIGNYERAQAGIAKTGERIKSLEGNLAGANDKVARQSTVVSKVSDNYRNLQIAARTAARHQNDLQEASNKTADALTRQSGQINKAEVELQQLSAAAGKADAAMAKLADQSGRALQESFDKQRRATLETKREWVQLTQQASKLAAEIGRVGVPTRAMAEAFIRNKAEAARAKQEYIEQRNSLHALSGVLRQTGTDLDSLRSKQAQFANIQQQTGAAIARIRTQAQQASGSYSLLSGNATRSAAGVRQVAQSARTAAAATQQAAGATRTLSQAYQQLYGDSRKALSFTQRLRGQVLSLIAAYGGFYGVVNTLGKVVNAYQTLEAAQARLGVAFDGDVKATAKELDFLRRTADRLGIEFGALAGEYSKFAIATKNTSLEGANTRKIFLSVAEAARVNRSSFEEMKGVFVALTQIVSKGAVQMEELRQQLGDRLPGALKIMADGLGVSTAELVKMMEQGQITEAALVPFAEELDKRFGPGLAEALKGTTTALGRFQNAAFQALLQFANAGFIESFTGLLNDLTYTLKDADFQSFAARASQAFGVLIDTLGLAVRNFDLLVIAASAFAGIKLAPFIAVLAARFGILSQSTRGVVGSFSRLGTIMAATVSTMRASAGAAGVAAAAVRGLTLAFRVLLSSTGIGLAITAISIAIGYWATRADEATEALNRHQKLVDKVKDAYEKAGKAAAHWADEIARGSITEAQQNLVELKKKLDEVRASATAPVDAFGVDTAGTVAALQNAVDAFKEGRLSAADFKAAVDDIAQADPKLDRGVALELLKVAESAKEAEKSVAEAEAVLRILQGTATDADKVILGLIEATDSAAVSQRKAAEKTAEFNAAMKELGSSVKSVGDAFDIMKEKADLDEAFQSAARAAQTMQELDSAVRKYNEGLNQLYENKAGQALGSFTDGVQASAELLRQRESFRATTYADTGGPDGKQFSGYRIGFGSDTVTLSDGTIKKVTQGMRISVADANRDLYRRIGEFQNTIKGQIGADRFAQFNAQQQAALTSIAYNYGSLPDRIIAAVKSGTDQEIADAIRGLAGDNGGVNANRRRIEAGLFTTQGGVGAASQDFQRQQEKADQERQKAEEERQKQRESTAEQIAANQQGIEQQQLINDGKAREAEIQKAIIEAKKQDPNITDEEIAKIREQTGLMYDLKNVRTEDKNVQKEAAAASERVNALLSQRTALESTLAAARKSGDTTKVNETETALQAVNAQLEEAIAKARAMWEAIGGTAADTALIKLDTAAIKAQKMATQADENYFSWKKVGDLFVNGLTNAFDQFAQAVANGENVGEAARKAFLQFAADFLREIAQMIIKQALFNALKGATGGGSFLGSLVGAGHTGGLIGSKRVGSGNTTRRVNPAIFAGAMRYHTGGVPGLAPNEVPIIAKKNEEILAANDPRNALNGGGRSPGTKQKDPKFKIVNAFDSAGMLEEAMTTETGEKAILNFVRRNSSAFKAAIGG